jgi:putative ABC transport system substrate-binding protein
MKRREFITLLGGTAAAWPLAARAQRPDRVRRIGVLMPFAENEPEGQARVKAFRQGLADLRWTEGRNLQIEYRWAGAEISRIRTYAAELVGLAPDVVIANSTGVLAALHEATGSIPVVFVLVNDPVGLGYVASMARPGGNITGFSYIELSLVGKWLDLLKQIAPSVRRVTLPFNPDTTPYYPDFLRSLPQSIAAEFEGTPVRDVTELERAIAAAARGSGGGLIIPAGPFIAANLQLIVRLAEQLNLPAVSIYRQYAVDGGLMSYGADTLDIFRRSASYVDRILKGEKPADLPVQAPTKYEFVINLKTAKALGLTVPPSLLAVADEVIE